MRHFDNDWLLETIDRIFTIRPLERHGADAGCRPQLIKPTSPVFQTNKARKTKARLIMICCNLIKRQHRPFSWLIKILSWFLQDNTYPRRSIASDWVNKGVSVFLLSMVFIWGIALIITGGKLHPSPPTRVQRSCYSTLEQAAGRGFQCTDVKILQNILGRNILFVPGINHKNPKFFFLAPARRSLRGHLQGTPRCEPPPKERVGIFGERCEMLE